MLPFIQCLWFAFYAITAKSSIIPQSLKDSLPGLVPMCLRVCIAKTNTMTKNNLERKEFISAYSPQVIVYHWGKSKQTLKAELNRDHRGVMLLPCYPWLTQPAFLYARESPSQEWHRPRWTRLFYINQKSRKCPTSLPTGQLLGILSQLRFHLPR